MAEDEDVDYEAWEDDEEELVAEPVSDQAVLSANVTAIEPQGRDVPKEPDKSQAAANATIEAPHRNAPPEASTSAAAAAPLPGSNPAAVPSETTEAKPAAEFPSQNPSPLPASQPHAALRAAHAAASSKPQQSRAPVPAPRIRQPIPVPPKPDQQQAARGRGWLDGQQGDMTGRSAGQRLPPGNIHMGQPHPSQGNARMRQAHMAARLAGHMPHMHQAAPQAQQQRAVLPMPPMTMMINQLAMAKAALPSSHAPRAHGQQAHRGRGQANSSHSDSSSRERRGDSHWSPTPHFSVPELAGPSLSGDFDDPDDPFAKKASSKAAPPLPARTGRTSGSGGLSLAHGMDSTNADKAPISSRLGSRLHDNQANGRLPNAPGPRPPPLAAGSSGLAMPPALPQAAAEQPEKPKRLADYPPLGSTPPPSYQEQQQTARALELQQQEQALQAAMAAKRRQIENAEKDKLKAQIQAAEERIAKLAAVAEQKKAAEAQAAADRAAADKAAADKAEADKAAAQKAQAERAAAEAAAVDRAKAKSAQQAASKRPRSEPKDERANGARSEASAASRDASSGRSSRSKRGKQDTGGRAVADKDVAAAASAADTAMDEWGPAGDARGWEQDAAELPSNVDLRTLLTRSRSDRKSGDDGKDAKVRRVKYQQPYKPPARGSDR